MKRFLLTLALVGALALFALPAFADQEADNQGITVGTGALRLGGLVQTGFTYYVGNEVAEGRQAVQRESDYGFWMGRVRLLAAGQVIDDRVSYLMQFEFGRDSGRGTAMMDDILLDAKIGFHYIPYTAIYVGRFTPNFTFFAPRNSGKLMFIDYPMMNQDGENGIFDSRRQTGLEFAVETTYLDANLGVFNGREYFPPAVAPQAADPVGNLGWGDQNNGKDIYINLIGKPPVEGLKIFAGLFYGTPLDGWEFDNNNNRIEHNATATLIDAGAFYMAPFGLTLGGELLYAMYNYDQGTPADPNVDRAADTWQYQFKSMSYYIMGGFNFGPLFEVPVELLLRYDFLDPNTENNNNHVGTSEDDALNDIFVGVNYYLKAHNAMLYLNYIHHGESYDIPNVARDDTQTGISNDEIKLQAQVAF
jgi:hypothetical protein